MKPSYSILMKTNYLIRCLNFRHVRGFYLYQLAIFSPFSIFPKTMQILFSFIVSLLLFLPLLTPGKSFAGVRTLGKKQIIPGKSVGPTTQVTTTPKVDYGETQKSTITIPISSQTILSLSLSKCVRIGVARNFQIQVDQLNPHVLAQEVTREDAKFDTVGFADGSIEESFAPDNSTVGGIRRSETDKQAINIGIRRRYKTGTTYEIKTGLDQSRNNTTTTRFNPAVKPTLSLTLSQNLLKDFGRSANTTSIRIARNNQNISVSQFRESVIKVVTEIENFYWELAFAIEELEVKKRSLILAQDLLRRNKIQVKVGTLAPIEIVQAQASIASREAGVISAQRQVQDNEDRLKRALNIPTHIASWNKRIHPKDQPKIIRRAPEIQKSFVIALKNRPDYKEAKIDLENRNIQTRFAKNQLLPTLDLKGSIDLNGLDREFSGAVDDLGRGEFYKWTIGITFEFPLSNRAARSTLLRRRMEKARALLSLKSLEQQIFLEVREAVRAILTAQKQVDSTRAAQVLVERQLEAEEKKFAVGLSTNFQVLTFQDDLAAARSSKTRATIDQIQALVNFRKVTGQTLLFNQIRFEKSGRPR